MLIGYARTSTTDQQAGFDAQLVELETGIVTLNGTPSVKLVIILMCVTFYIQGVLKAVITMQLIDLTGVNSNIRSLCIATPRNLTILIICLHQSACCPQIKRWLSGIENNGWP